MMDLEKMRIDSMRDDIIRASELAKLETVIVKLEDEVAQLKKRIGELERARADD
jgi:hypothetical protein